MKFHFVGFFTLIFSVLSHGQNIKTWSIIFGTEKFTGLTPAFLPEDLPHRIVENNEGCFYLTGSITHGGGTPKPQTIGTWLAKFTPEGKLAWWRWGYAGHDVFNPHHVTATSDGE